ncbi:metalloregulator ArsR/SmtB family transcription factor [Ferrovibrio sp. MS7]|uniref:ArsR/SmtB family transcription factor n=1 Tax=Ferrovibrio plantarum TaxID=3119164 RepID=UPI0031372430
MDNFDNTGIMKRIDDASAVAAFASLAQGTRLAIYRLLVGYGAEGLCAGEIAETLAVPAATLSFHLAHLHRAGLIRQRRDSRLLIYSIDIDRMNEVIAFLSDHCCGGKPELCRPAVKGKRHEPVQRTRKAV